MGQFERFIVLQSLRAAIFVARQSKFMVGVRGWLKKLNANGELGLPRRKTPRLGQLLAMTAKRLSFVKPRKPNKVNNSIQQSFG